MKRALFLIYCYSIYCLNASSFSEPGSIAMTEFSAQLIVENTKTPDLGNPCFVVPEILCHTFGCCSFGHRNDMLDHLARKHLTLDNKPLSQQALSFEARRELVEIHLKSKNLRLLNAYEDPKLKLCHIVGCAVTGSGYAELLSYFFSGTTTIPLDCLGYTSCTAAILTTCCVDNSARLCCYELVETYDIEIETRKND